MSFYFDKYENRMPSPPIAYSSSREMLWQFLAVVNLVLGGWYIYWRWGYSINYNALWFGIPLIIAETGSFIGLILFTFNLWKTKDTPIKQPPFMISECVHGMEGREDRPISVDVFFPTYSEDPELVRLSIIDAKKIRYPHPIIIKIHVLDDGKRPEMKKVAEEEGTGYHTRSSNIGYKAGNMRNAMERTYGDFIVICDADTRPFPTMLERMLGYFRDPDVAWVQSPQWFFDLYEGEHLRERMNKFFWYPGYWIGAGIEKIFGDIMVGSDPLANDPTIFYDVILRRRNWANASFCCGAGSIHRREAVMEAALKTLSSTIEKETKKLVKDVKDKELKSNLTEEVSRQLLFDTELTPYKFHVSEDIYTSMVLHGDRDRHWKSVFHPYVESKMLSPQDLLSWTIQRFKYAGGTLDICKNDNPIFRKGLNLKQKLLYGATFWSYFGGVWNTIFLLSPIIFLFTGIAPVSAYTSDFFIHIIPFLFLNEIAFMIGTWGISGWGGKASYISFFPVNLRAIWTVIKGEKIKFPVTPKDIQKGNYFKLVIPQFTLIVLTFLGLVFYGFKLLMGWETNLSAFVANAFWGANNIFALSGIVIAAFFKPEE